MSLTAQTVQTLYTDISQGNLSRILSVIDQNTVIYKPDSLPYGGVYKGRDGLISLMTAVNQTWASMQVIPTSVINSDREIVITGQCIGKAWTTAKEIRFPFVHLWKLLPDLVTEIWLYYWDTAQIITYLSAANQ